MFSFATAHYWGFGHVTKRGRAGWSLQNRIRTALRSRLTDNLEPSRYVFLEMTSLRKGAKGLDGFNFAQLFDVLHPIASSFK